MPIKIDLPDMASRVTHGFHLTNEEARWLLKQIGIDVPLRRRCNVCGGEGMYVDILGPSTSPVFTETTCHACHGECYLPAEEPEYEVVLATIKGYDCTSLASPSEPKKDPACEYCTEPGASCGSMGDGYYCTRTAGHSGQHVACGRDTHPIHTWPASPSEEPAP